MAAELTKQNRCAQNITAASEHNRNSISRGRWISNPFVKRHYIAYSREGDTIKFCRWKRAAFDPVPGAPAPTASSSVQHPKGHYAFECIYIRAISMHQQRSTNNCCERPPKLHLIRGASVRLLTRSRLLKRKRQFPKLWCNGEKPTDARLQLRLCLQQLTANGEAVQQHSDLLGLGSRVPSLLEEMLFRSELLYISSRTKQLWIPRRSGMITVSRNKR